ncbi:DUF2283 domain-containing protein [Candidatus Pacearchaeota archaeon]|nr:DUF2283 domain-containing protein [Candidatus Pacearchaeota archaeon]
MRIEFDKDIDAAFVYFKEISPGEVKKTISLNDSLNIDLDSEGRILGIEILNASKNMPTSSVQQIISSCI